MKCWAKYLLFFVVVLTPGVCYELNADLTAISSQFPEVKEVVAANDTIPRFPVSPIVPETQKDLEKTYPIDLETPLNLDDSFEYNPLTNRYEMRPQIGGVDITTPISLTQEEYLNYTLQKSMGSYFKSRNAEEDANAPDGGKKNDDGLSMFDFNFDLGPADKIFGPGGVRLQAQGSTTVKVGLVHSSNDNPSLPAAQRNHTTFKFDPQIQTNIAASVGDKLNFDLNYNTESTFDFDSKKLKLGYTGKEDEIIKVLEAGNVSMNTTNSLIRGGAALFGIKTELQFGKLTVGAIFSQQESQSRTTSSKGSVQTTPYELTVDNYDENMHFFLTHYFHDTYDHSMETLPYIQSGISIDRIEVWVTNKRSNYNQARNIVAFADLGEQKHISNPVVVQATQGIPQDNPPYQRINNLYEKVLNVRSISQVNQELESLGLRGGQDYEKIENARKLETSEYRLNEKLGYISLRTPLQPDEVLAVAFSYSYDGKVYQVGEFSTDNPNNTTDNLLLKMIKGTAQSPASPGWRLMMKNVYTITTRSLQPEKFRLDVKYQNDTTGVYLNYLTEGAIANQLLLRVENLDRLDTRQEPYADGFFDFVEGYTVLSQYGKIIFPAVEPFGGHLRKKIANDVIADKYVFQELYDSTLTVARQTAEKNKFVLTGEYKGSSGSNIDLDGYQLARGSVTVTADGRRLQENSDYTVNYATGEVTIINPAYENANIQTSYENQSNFGMQRKTMMGLNLNYAFSPKFNLGATIMNLSEMPLTLKTGPGEESINNTLFGFNTNYSAQSQWLTNVIDKLPFVELTAPSQITLNAEYAQLIPGHYKSEWGGDYSYIDDFERAKVTIDLRSDNMWKLSSTPSLFPEAAKANDITYGNNRSLLAWYRIDQLFTRKSSLTPTHIKNDEKQLSNHYVREIREDELFPNKDTRYDESSTIPVLNMAFYPKERGPYNLDAAGMNPDGTLSNPESRWGGVYRRIESGQTDFEANNIEHIEFWLMDPFIYDKTAQGGDLYFNLGEISEDVLKDEKKFFENGLPVNDNTAMVDTTIWGKVPRQQSLNYAFDNTQAGSRRKQDAGLNGLTTEEEFGFPAYEKYLNDLKGRLSPETMAQMENDPFSPLNDPSGDNYHYYRGADYDRENIPILGRYKRYNGTEGNSASSDDSSESYGTAATVNPDVEDINQDNTLNENEKYFQYKVSIRPEDLVVGDNFIVDKRETTPLLKDGSRETVTWYQFKIPIEEFESSIGGIRDFQTIRFIRMFMTSFSDSTILRFGTLELVRGDWRIYTKDLRNNAAPSSNTTISLSTVNIEENGDKEPVNYIMPPGVNRMTDPGQPQLIMQNEQSLSAQIKNLSSGDSRAIYKKSGLDTRQYRRLQMFVHAEKLVEDAGELNDNELSVFLRLGSDYKNNYYEYEIPLKITPPAPPQGYSGNNNSDRETVWNPDNMFDFPFKVLTDLKLNRNKEKRKAGSEVSYTMPYSEFDPAKPLNKMTVIGNPTLSEVKVIMIGVRNNSHQDKSVEIWTDELRLTDFNEDGGWAGNVNLFVGLSDLGSLNFAGRKETAGFGSLDQGIMDRSLDDKQSVNFSAQIDMGKFFPEKANVSMPVYYSYREDLMSPKYNPLDQDILLKDALDAAETEAERDSIKSFAQDKVINRSFDINNVRVNVVSKRPMPYDPANFTLGYSFTENKVQNATTEYERETDQRLLFGYLYSPMIKPWKPFGKLSGKENTQNNARRSSASGKIGDEIQINWLPKNIAFNSDINRNYFESKLRDLGNLGENMIPVAVREEFYWNRTSSIQWDLTKNLLLNLNTGTNARIDAPHVQVNKKLNMSEYNLWKDSVMTSIRGLGTPMDYNQNFTTTYQLPFRAIPVLNFINGSLSYRAQYSWERGAVIPMGEKTLNTGNVITNERTIGLENVTFNLLNLYNKFAFLDKANKKYTMSRPAANMNRNRQNRQTNQRNQKAANEKKNKKYESPVQLNQDSATVVKHSLDNKRLRVTARGADGKLYEISYKAIDNNTIRINNKDSVELKLTIAQLPPLDDLPWYKVAQGIARGLMMVRNFSFTYTQTQGMMIPNFQPEIGDFFGQGNTVYGKAPGVDFAFGLTDETYLDRAYNNGWLIKDKANVNPAMFNKTEMFNFTALLEPIVGLKINLTANRTSTNQNQIYFMHDGMPKRFTGNFSMTTVSLRSIFENSNSSDDYFSESFQTFLNNRQIIADRWENAYRKVSKYPDVGFLQEIGYAGQPYIHEESGVNLNSSDVLIPAFISAYMGKNPKTVDLNFFPALRSLLPNWRVTYEGLIQLPFIRKHFKSFSLEHEYRCRYSVGAYNSYLDWVEAADGIGFIRNNTTNRPVASSPYDITAVSIVESFDPLIRINSTFLNNMSLKMEYKTSRNINLNISSYQIVEMTTTDFGAGVGYRFENFNKVLNLPKTGGANFNNELKVSADISYGKSQNLIRKIQDAFTQPTSGNRQITMQFTADYNMSKLITLQAFFDRQSNKPLVSSSAFNSSQTAFGFSVKVSLTR